MQTDLTVRVDINVNGLCEEDFDLEVAKRIREATFIQYPEWVDDRYVNYTRALRCFELVREELLSGTPTIEVARHVQILNEWKDKKLGTVRVYLEHFKATLPKTQMLARMVPAQYVETKKKVDKSLDCLVALEELYGMMMDRIKIGMKREVAMEFLMNGMEKQFAGALDILSKIHEIKSDLRGNPIDISNDMKGMTPAIDWTKVYSSPNVNEVMSDPEKRARLVRMVENLAKLSGKMTPEQHVKTLKSAEDKIKGES